MPPSSGSLAPLALFGGTFDPIHLGHLDLAKSALNTFHFKKLYFVPAQQNPLKSRHPNADASSRWAMVDLALKEYGEPDFEALDWEIKSTGPSYSIHTVDKMRETFQSPVTLVMGNEVFSRIAQWKEPKRLLQSADCVIVTRAPDLNIEVFSTLQSLGLADIKHDGTWMTHSGGNRKVVPLPFSPLPFSATHLRLEIKKQWEFNNVSEPPQGIQRSVWQFIKGNRLYAVKKG